MLNNAEAREIGDLARRLYRALDSRLPRENNQLDALARIQAKDALERILQLVARSAERSV